MKRRRVVLTILANSEQVWIDGVRAAETAVGKLEARLKDAEKRAADAAGAAAECSGDRIELLNLRSDVRSLNARLAHAESVLQDDVRALLLALGLSDHARPVSPHRVIVDEVLPAIRALRGRPSCDPVSMALLRDSAEALQRRVDEVMRGATVAR